jgi:hypothetical protein
VSFMASLLGTHKLSNKVKECQHPPLFNKLHNFLVESYKLKSTKKMSSVESLALLLGIVGAPQSVR